MIELFYHHNKSFVYKIDDWKLLRENHRIVGEIIGSNQHSSTLPVALLTEEALFLVNKGLATLIKVTTAFDDDENLNYYEELKSELMKNQKDVYLETRKKEIEFYSQKIISGKRKRGDTREDDEILKDELSKPINVDDEMILWPILLTLPNTKKEHVDICVLKEQTTKVKYMIFDDLWNRGYFITAGEKFGADFLVYLGDPIHYHAVFLVRCIDSVDEKIHPTEIVAYGRLGSSVKKKAVMATVDKNDAVSYISLNWINSQIE